MKDVAAAVVRIYFELCCLIVGETFFPAHPAERFCAKWEGEGDVDYDVFVPASKFVRTHIPAASDNVASS